jgi:hypothetical protein
LRERERGIRRTYLAYVFLKKEEEERDRLASPLSRVLKQNLDI